MKFYVLEGMINSRPIKRSDRSSRRKAEEDMENYLTKYDLQVVSDRFLSKHTEEFVCDQHTRFTIRRVVIE